MAYPAIESLVFRLVPFTDIIYCSILSQESRYSLETLSNITVHAATTAYLVGPYDESQCHELEKGVRGTD